MIKYYAWELKFIGKISEARRVELQSLRSYILVGALLHLLWDIVPAVVGATAFIIHTYALGNFLTMKYIFNIAYHKCINYQHYR